MRKVANPQDMPYDESMDSPPAFAHTIGTKYEATQTLDIAEIAKLVRAGIKAAVRSGRLPGDVKYRVRIQRYSLGQSVDVTAEFPRPTSRQLDHEFPDMWAYTPEAEMVRAFLQGLVDAYNYDNSDLQSDYHCQRFHSSIVIDGLR